MPRKRYYTIDYTLSALPALFVAFEDRPQKYMFGCNNYGEVPGFYNVADGDAWDVFAPGYAFKQLRTDVCYKVRCIIGYLKLQNGNHKIAVRLHENGYCGQSSAEEIERYCKVYTKRVCKGEWIQVHNADPTFTGFVS